jgi:Peptidase_C39 like family
MPNIVKAQPIGSGFNGLKQIFQYTNDDGVDPATVCGQAACATLLTYLGAKPAITTLQDIEKNHHPDLLGGKFGTSPWRIEGILEAYGATPLKHVSKEEDLKSYVAKEDPVICLIQNEGGIGGLFSGGAHWFVVFAYDDQGVFVTNYGSTVHLTWADFRSKWNSTTTWFASVDFKAITTTARTLVKVVPRPPMPIIPRFRK